MTLDSDNNDPSWLARGGSTNSTEVRDYYDRWAETYDDALHEWGYEAPRGVAQRMAKRLTPHESVILDAGCGTGLSGLALQNAGFQHIDGMDLSPKSLEKAATTGAYRTVIEHNLAERFPFSDGTYDGVQCVGVLTYLPNPESVFREFARVTRKGGTIVFTQRSDLYDTLSFSTLLDKLATEEGLWHVIERSKPSPYLPHNSNFEDRIQVIYCVCERC